jgi:hypothetical protein
MRRGGTVAADTLLLPVLAALAFVALVGVTGWLAVQPVHAAALLLGVTVFDALNIPLAFHVGLSLYPADLAFLLLGAAAAVRFCLFATTRSVPGGWWLLGMVQLGLAVWGVQALGTAAGVDARGHFYVWVCVVYFCSVRWNDATLARVVKLWLLCAFCLCLLAWYRWINSALDPQYEQEIMAMDTTGVRFRVLSSSAALVIAIGTLGLLFRMVIGKLAPPLWLLVPLQLITIAVLQHRSVWVSLAIGMACLLLATPGTRKTPGAVAALAVLVLPLALALVLPGGDNAVVESVRHSADQAVSLKEGTMVGRTVFWDVLLRQWAGSGDLRTYLVGRPYGSGYAPFQLGDGTVLDMVPHNQFIHLLYRGGLIGLVAMVSVFLRTWKAALAQTRRPDRPWAPFLMAVLSALFAYFIPYWATPEGGLFLGAAISYLGVGRTACESRWELRQVARFAPCREIAPFRTALRQRFRSAPPAPGSPR